MIVGTPASRALCKAIAAKTECVVLGFSRGKDSIAAALWLREFFPRLILFHVDGCPGLSFVERSLAYYEDVFETPIERHPSQLLLRSLGNLVYQPIEDEDWIDGLGLDGPGNDEIAYTIRAVNQPDAWVAWGISLNDSIVRRSQAKYRNGINEAKRVFYPCFDWQKQHVMQAITASDIRLPDDYLLSSRSYAEPLNFRGLERMREMMPDDFERVKFFYPFIEAAVARNEFRRQHKLASESSDVGGENNPSLPETGTKKSRGRALAKTQANSRSGSTSQQAAEASS